jgi:meiosis arrest female protein 1
MNSLVSLNSVGGGAGGFHHPQQQNQVSMSGPGGHSQQGPGMPPLAGQLALFSRELVDLLKSQAGCRMPFHKFIPSYHHHFGRQCRVADYGYTKLKELFEALPHVVQIMGEGSRAMITLSHRAQIKRFTSDLLRALKSQTTKQVSLVDFPGLFAKVMSKPFKISDYGVCDVEDLLIEISETSIVLSTVVTGPDGHEDLMIAIPKREQVFGITFNVVSSLLFPLPA